MEKKRIWQVLTDGNMGTVLQSWWKSKTEAEKDLADCSKFWPEDEFWIEEGTEYIHERCRHCGTVEASECFDAYGISTGFWCIKCYDSTNYPYRKDRYDYAGNGESLDYNY